MSGVLVDPVACREKALERLSDLPPFSPILNRLVATLASDDVSFAQVSDLIEKDTVLAGNVLRIVNSALYGRRGTISSVRHAVSILGLTKLRNTVMSLSVARIWGSALTPKGWPAARFNEHGVAAAVMADILALKVPCDYPEGAFVGGLLHDMGFLLLSISDPDVFCRIRDLHQATGKPIQECEHEIVGMDHAELSTAALNNWNLPEPIQKAVRYQFDRQRRTDEEFPLSWLIHAAEHLVTVRELTIFELSEPPGADPAEVLKPLGLDDRWDDLLDEFEREFEPIRSFF